MINLKSVILSLLGCLGTVVQADQASPPEPASSSAHLVLLGTGGGPGWRGDDTPYGISSALVVEGKAYIVDFGSGAYRQLRRAGVKPGEEAALFFTHLHSDHVIDLPTLLLFDPIPRKLTGASLQIFGPGPRPELPPMAANVSDDILINPENPSPGTRDMVNALVGALATDMNIRTRHEGLPDLRQFFDAHDIALPNTLKIDVNSGEWPRIEPFEVWRDDKVRVTATLVSHGLVFPNFAYRFDTDYGSVVFSGDTNVSENLITLASGADILVHEAIDPTWILGIVGEKPWNAQQEALADQLQNTHVTPKEAGEVAALAGVKTLVLSHLVPGNSPRKHWLGAEAAFDGELIVGEDLMVIELD